MLLGAFGFVHLSAWWISLFCLVKLQLTVSQLMCADPKFELFWDLSSLPTFVIVIDELFGADLALEQTIQNSKVIVAFVIVAF